MPKPRFDASEILSRGTPDDSYYEPVDEDMVGEDQIYHGKHARWVGTPGYMIRIPVDKIIPEFENEWYPDQLARYVEAVEDGELLEAPAARIYPIHEGTLQASQEWFEEGLIDRPFTEDDLGEPWADVRDGNHRAFAAVLAGEPYVWLYVEENSRKRAEPWME